MEIQLGNEEIRMVIAALRSNGHSQMYKLSDKIEAQTLEWCTASLSGKHYMTQPDDTPQIKWGEFGICTSCFAVRKMK